MAQWYDIGLQAGKKVAEKINGFIKAENKSETQNFNPVKQKTLEDGTTVYKWYMKWAPYMTEEERRLLDVLDEFRYIDGTYFDIPENELIDYAFKLVAVGDEGGEDEYYNPLGEEYFDELYNACRVTYPEGFDDNLKKWAVIVTYSDMPIEARPRVKEFRTEEEAKEYLKADYLNEVRIDTTENGHVPGEDYESMLEPDNSYAEIVINYNDCDDKTCWYLTEVES